MLEEDNEIYQFTITIKQIKLSVKFPCKLTVNYLNRALKTDVNINESGKYVIDRQVKVKSENNQPIQILIHLTTEKGGNIMAGVIKLNSKDLASSQNQVLNVNLQKCLDQTASCTIKIDRVWLTRNSKAKSLIGQFSTKNRKTFGDEGIGSGKKLPPTIVDNYRNNQTRSEFPGFNLKRPTVSRKQNGIDSYNNNKLYGLGPKSYVPQIAIGKSKNLDRSMQFRKQTNKYRLDDDNKTVGKRQIDPSYRLNVQANQKNLKMDIMKYKMKCEQHQKTIQQKTKQIKQLKQQISELHRQSVQKNFYQQQINSKNQIIQKLEDNNKGLNKENNRLESRIIELERAVQEAKNSLSAGVQRAKEEKERKEFQFNKELTIKKDQIGLLNDQLKSKNNQINRIKKIIQDLQKSLQSKTFDYEKSLQGQRAQMSKLENLLNDKIKQLEQMNKSLTVEKQGLSNELQKKTQQIQKYQSNTTHLMAEVKQTSQLQKYYATYKIKFGDLEKAYEKLQQEKKEVEKHYLKLLESKERDLGDFKEEQSGLINSYKKKNNQLTEKSKQQTAKILELQNKVAFLCSQIDKLKRNLQLAQKQLSTLTQTQKNLTQTNKQKDEQLLAKQKELSQLQSKLATRQSLMKKDIEYKTQQLQKISAKLNEHEHLYRQQKEANQTLRFQSTKLEGKHKLQEEIISRLNRQIQQSKQAGQKRQLEFREEIKELEAKIKLYEQMEKKFNKQVTEYELQDLNRKNQINRLSKQLQIKNQKLDRQVKKNQQQYLVNKQLVQINKQLEQKLNKSDSQLKQLQNNKKALEADFTKTQKIKTIIVEQKTSVQNQLVLLKKDIQSRLMKEQELNKEIKQLKQELTKMSLKSNNVTKYFESFKENLYNTIQASFYSSNGKLMNNGFNLSLNFNGKDTQRTGLHYRVNSSTNINDSFSYGSPRRLHESQVVNSTTQEHYIYEPRFNQIIETYGRQSQQTINNLNQNIKKNKSQIQRLERQSSNLSSRLQSTEQEAANAISSLERQIQSVKSKHQEAVNQWEQKFMLSQRANRQKQQMIEQLNDELQSVNHQMATNARTHQIQLQQLGLKIQQLKSKIYDLEAKNDFSNMTILSYQQKAFTMQSTISQLQEQLQFQLQKVQRKDKLITQHIQKIQSMTKLIQQNKKQKLQLNRELLTTKQKLQAQKQINAKHKKMLQEQEQKNKEIKGFTTNLIKQKQTIVKNELQKSQKVMELEDFISRLKIEKNDISTELETREKNIVELKGEIKKNIATIKQLQTSLERQSHELHKYVELNKQKQKKLQQKQLQIKNMQINLQKLLSKYDQDTKRLNKELQDEISKYNKQLEEKKTKILELSNEIEKLNHLEKKISQQNIQLEEQIFFEKQNNSLANSRFQSMGRDINGLESKLTEAIKEINLLNDQIRDRQEKLFDMSNKLYNLEQKLDMKQIEMRQKMEKLDIDWKNKYEQTLQDYQIKLQSYQRQKYYFRTKLQQEMQEISKLQNQKRIIMIQEQTDKKIYQQKLKKLQNQKLSLLVQKNKQIQKLRSQIQLKQDKIKQIKHQKDIKQDDIKRFQQKLKQKQQKLIHQQQRSLISYQQLQKQLQYQKKKQSQIKKYKQLVKNNLWSSQRQIKKILQSYIKNIMILCEQEKKKDLIDVMKNVENQIIKAIEFNVDQVA